MNRRTAIKQLFVVAGGMMIATSCDFTDKSTSIVLNHLKLNKADEDLLAELTESLIPKTDTPGAKDLNLHLFVMKMVDDCSSPEEQKAFVEGLKGAETIKGKGLKDMQTYLAALPAEDVFFQLLKRRTIQGYLNSEYVMKNKLVYELVPGRYNGAMKVNG